MPKIDFSRRNIRCPALKKNREGDILLLSSEIFKLFWLLSFYNLFDFFRYTTAARKTVPRCGASVLPSFERQPVSQKNIQKWLGFYSYAFQQCWGSLLPVKQACRYSATVFGFFRAKSDTKSINALCPPQSSSSASDTFAGAMGHAPLHQEA